MTPPRSRLPSNQVATGGPRVLVGLVQEEIDLHDAGEVHADVVLVHAGLRRAVNTTGDVLLVALPQLVVEDLIEAAIFRFARSLCRLCRPRRSSSLMLSTNVAASPWEDGGSRPPFFSSGRAESSAKRAICRLACFQRKCGSLPPQAGDGSNPAWASPPSTLRQLRRGRGSSSYGCRRGARGLCPPWASGSGRVASGAGGRRLGTEPRLATTQRPRYDTILRAIDPKRVRMVRCGHAMRHTKRDCAHCAERKMHVSQGGQCNPVLCTEVEKKPELGFRAKLQVYIGQALPSKRNAAPRIFHRFISGHDDEGARRCTGDWRTLRKHMHTSTHSRA